MYLTVLPIEDAVGHLLCHNLADATGRKAFKKGQRVAASDLDRLRELGYQRLRVAVLAEGDIHEDEAARRLGQVLAGKGARASSAVTGRVNLLAARRGLLEIDLGAIERVNTLDGLTVATLPRHRVVDERAILATIKVIPYAVPEQQLREAEAVGAAFEVLPLLPLRVGVVLVGHPNAEARVRASVYPAIASRVAELGAEVGALDYVATDEAAVQEAIEAQRRAGAELFILAGETSIMDANDVIPAGIVAAGGRIVHYGAPVEPGNLLLLAELPAQQPGKGPIAVVGAPGCVRSRDINVVDLILPRLLAGQRLGKADIAALGHGGLLL